MRDPLPDLVRLPDEPANHLARFGYVLIGLLLLVLLLGVAFLIGEKLDQFSWTTLGRGLLAFGTILLSVAVAVALLTVTTRFLVLMLPQQTRRLGERRRLDRARRATLKAIGEKERLSEERIRITARLQATWLFEKESGRMANQRAVREFREALQSGVVRSCGIAFEHVGRVVDEYERLVAEITDSELPDDEKTSLLNTLTRQLDVAAQRRRDREIRQEMTTQIWKVRLRKARLLSRDNPAAAERYLDGLLSAARSPELRRRLREIRDQLRRPAGVD